MVVAVERMQHIYGEHGTQRGSEVVAQPVISYALAPARRGEHVYGHGACRHGSRPERRPVQGPEQREHGHAARHDIAEEQQAEEEVADHKHDLARIVVHHIAAEQPYYQGHDRISRKRHTYGVVACAEGVAKVQRQQRHDQGEREIQQEISRPHLKVVGIPQSVLHLTHPAFRP